MAKNENTEQKENLSTKPASDQSSDTNKNKNQRYNRRRPYKKQNSTERSNAKQSAQADNIVSSNKETQESSNKTTSIDSSKKSTQNNNTVSTHQDVQESSGNKSNQRTSKKLPGKNAAQSSKNEQRHHKNNPRQKNNQTASQPENSVQGMKQNNDANRNNSKQNNINKSLQPDNSIPSVKQDNDSDRNNSRPRNNNKSLQPENAAQGMKQDNDSNRNNSKQRNNNKSLQPENSAQGMKQNNDSNRNNPRRNNFKKSLQSDNSNQSLKQGTETEQFSSRPKHNRPQPAKKMQERNAEKSGEENNTENSNIGNNDKQRSVDNGNRPYRKNYRNNRNNRRKPQDHYSNNKKEEQKDLPLPLEEIRELKAVPEEPNVDMDFSFLEASREDIEDMIAEMDEEGNDVTEPTESHDKYKKEKIIIGSANDSGAVLMPLFFKRVAEVKALNKSADKDLNIKKTAPKENKPALKEEKTENKNVKAPEAAVETKDNKKPNKHIVAKKADKTGVSVLSRMFLEKYNLIKPIEEVIEEIVKPQEKPIESRVIEVEKIEPEEPVKEEDIIKYDKLSFDPKVQKYDKKIEFEKIEPVNFITQRTSLSDRQAKHPAVRKVLDVVDAFLNNDLHIDHTYNMLLAVSGGVDSIVLFDAIALLSEKYNYNIAIAHYNHNLRGTESDADEKFVKQFAEKYNTKIYTANGKVRAYSEKNALSIEHAARILRYKFFERTSRNIDADFVATAHTADDSAETLLLNLLRGTGLTGLAGIPKIRTFVKNVRLIRPLIELKKEDLITYAKERRLLWKEDKSNQLLDYTRNKVRLSLIPLLEKTFNPNIVDTLNRTAKLISGADEFISEMVSNSIDFVVDDVRQERFAVKTNLLGTFPEFVQGEIIQKLVSKYFRLSSLPMRKIADIIDLMKHNSGAIYQINKNYNVLMDRKKLIFTRVEDYEKVSESFLVEQGFENAEFSLKIDKVRKKDIKFNDNPYEEYIDKSKITKSLKIRHWEEGDTFIPLGMYGRMKVSDFLTNEKVALIDKSKVMVMVSGDEIVWIIGYRVSDKFKVDNLTREAYKLDFQNKNGYKNEQKSDGLE